MKRYPSLGIVERQRIDEARADWRNAESRRGRVDGALAERFKGYEGRHGCTIELSGGRLESIDVNSILLRTSAFASTRLVCTVLSHCTLFTTVSCYYIFATLDLCASALHCSFGIASDLRVSNFHSSFRLSPVVGSIKNQVLNILMRFHRFYILIVHLDKKIPNCYSSLVSHRENLFLQKKKSYRNFNEDMFRMFQNVSKFFYH